MKILPQKQNRIKQINRIFGGNFIICGTGLAGASLAALDFSERLKIHVSLVQIRLEAPYFSKLVSLSPFSAILGNFRNSLLRPIASSPCPQDINHAPKSLSCFDNRPMGLADLPPFASVGVETV